MPNHNNSGPGQSPDDDRTTWRPDDDENHSERDRDRSDYHAGGSGADQGAERDTGYSSPRIGTGSTSTGVIRGMGGHRGKGPQNWQRSDERIREAVNEALTDHDHVDATHIEVTVSDGEVTLGGMVEDRAMKRIAEDCVEQILGVREVQNHIRLHRQDGPPPMPPGDRKPRA